MTNIMKRSRTESIRVFYKEMRAMHIFRIKNSGWYKRIYYDLYSADRCGFPFCDRRYAGSASVFVVCFVYTCLCQNCSAFCEPVRHKGLKSRYGCDFGNSGDSSARIFIFCIKFKKYFKILLTKQKDCAKINTINPMIRNSSIGYGSKSEPSVVEGTVLTAFVNGSLRGSGKRTWS